MRRLGIVQFALRQQDTIAVGVDIQQIDTDRIVGQWPHQAGADIGLIKLAVVAEGAPAVFQAAQASHQGALAVPGLAPLEQDRARIRVPMPGAQVLVIGQQQPAFAAAQIAQPQVLALLAGQPTAVRTEGQTSRDGVLPLLDDTAAGQAADLKALEVDAGVVVAATQRQCQQPAVGGQRLALHGHGIGQLPGRYPAPGLDMALDAVMPLFATPGERSAGAVAAALVHQPQAVAAGGQLQFQGAIGHRACHFLDPCRGLLQPIQGELAADMAVGFQLGRPQPKAGPGRGACRIQRLPGQVLTEDRHPLTGLRQAAAGQLLDQAALQYRSLAVVGEQCRVDRQRTQGQYLPERLLRCRSRRAGRSRSGGRQCQAKDQGEQGHEFVFHGFVG